MITSKLWTVVFFNENVETLVLSMPRGIKVRFLKLMELIERVGPDLGMPHTRSLGKGLYEIRAKAPEGIGRYFYCTLLGDQLIVLHCFIKKTQKTPKKHLDIAIKRMNEVKNGKK